MVRETPTGLCQLTLIDAEGSAKYQGLPGNARDAVNLILTGLCNQPGDCSQAERQPVGTGHRGVRYHAQGADGRWLVDLDAAPP